MNIKLDDKERIHAIGKYGVCGYVPAVQASQLVKCLKKGKLTYTKSIIYMIKSNTCHFSILLFSIFLLSFCSGTVKTDHGPSPKFTSKSKLVIKPQINVFLENSGSMFGYVNGGTSDFQSGIYSYVSNIKNSGLISSIKLNYINSKIIPQGNDLKEFILNLTPYSFKKKGGNLASTDIPDLFDKVLKTTDNKSVSILITDAISSYSISSRGSKALGLIRSMMKDNILSQKNANPNLGIVVYQLNSEFSGTFYDPMNRMRKLVKKQRPFYIFLIGNNEYLKELITDSKTDINLVLGSKPENYFAFGDLKNSQSPYAIGRTPMIGGYDLDREKSKTVIHNARTRSMNGNEIFKFGINIDLKKSLLDNSYFMDKKNYSVSNPNYQIVQINSSHSNNYSHQIVMQSKIIFSGPLTISIKNQLPGWINNMNDENGNFDVPGVLDKTFGLKAVLGGIMDAYTNGNGQLSSYTIEINKN